MCQGDCVCGRSLQRAETIVCEKRQVTDVPEIKLTVTEHQALPLLCTCGREHKADFPPGIDAPMQYGSGVKALAVYLMINQLVPMERTQQIFKDILGISLTQGTLTTITTQAHNGLKKTEEAIK
jgi:transposase